MQVKEKEHTKKHKEKINGDKKVKTKSKNK